MRASIVDRPISVGGAHEAEGPIANDNGGYLVDTEVSRIHLVPFVTQRFFVGGHAESMELFRHVELFVTVTGV